MGCSGHAAVAAAATGTGAVARTRSVGSSSTASAAATTRWNHPSTATYLHTSAAHAADNNSGGSGGGGGGGKGDKGGRRGNADKRREGKQYDEAEWMAASEDGEEEVDSAEPPPVFEFSFDPANQQVFLKTGTVSPENVAAVRAEIKAHSDFSDELKLVDKSTHAVELYFLRVVAVNLARNPHMTVEEKREMISGIREMITDPELTNMPEDEDEV